MRAIQSRAQRATEGDVRSRQGNDNQIVRRRCTARGKRYSPAMKDEILNQAEQSSLDEAAKKYDVSPTTILRWCKEEERRGPSVARSMVKKSEEASDPQAEREAEILKVWKEHPGYGPSQVKNTIRREKGLKASVTTVRAVMEENGYIAPRRKAKEQRGRYEAGRPRELYHLDFCHFYVHKQKQCQLFIQDDFSRFIVGWALVPSESADPVIATFERSVERYGKPEAVMSDCGSTFHSWRGLSRFRGARCDRCRA